MGGRPRRTGFPCGDAFLILPGFVMGCKSGSCGVAPFLFAGWSVWLSSFVSCAAGPRVVLSRFVLECKFTQFFLNMEILEGVSPSRMPIFMYFSEFFRVKMEERGLQERQGRGGGAGGLRNPLQCSGSPNLRRNPFWISPLLTSNF